MTFVAFNWFSNFLTLDEIKIYFWSLKYKINPLYFKNLILIFDIWFCSWVVIFGDSQIQWVVGTRPDPKYSNIYSYLIGKDNQLGLDKYLNFSGRVLVLPKPNPLKKKEKRKERKKEHDQPTDLMNQVLNSYWCP